MFVQDVVGCIEHALDQIVNDQSEHERLWKANEKVGWYVDADGEVRHDLFRVLQDSDFAPGEPAQALQGLRARQDAAQ